MYSCRALSKLTGLKRQKNKLSSLSYRFMALPSHPSHEEHRCIRNDYSEEIWKAKQAHWHEFLEYAMGCDLWVANCYISGPGSDGGCTRIPTLLLVLEGPTSPHQEAVTNEEKSRAFVKIMFPSKPLNCLVPANYSYPSPLPSRGSITEDQVWRHIAKLSPFKATGTDQIPNVILKECVDALTPHLVRIFHAMFKLGVYYSQWKEIITCVLRKPGKPHYDIPKAYRPIALLNSIAKLATSIVAEELSYLVEANGPLPDTHFGSCLGQSTT